MPVIRSPDVMNSSTLNLSRNSAPASMAAPMRILSWTVAGADTIHREIPPDEREVAEVLHDRSDRRTIGLPDALEQAPSLQSRRPAAMDEMAVRDLARKRRSIHQQHAHTLSGEEHR